MKPWLSLPDLLTYTTTFPLFLGRPAAWLLLVFQIRMRNQILNYRDKVQSSSEGGISNVKKIGRLFQNVAFSEYLNFTLLIQMSSKKIAWCFSHCKLPKDHEKEVRIISMFIRCIHNTDFCTFVKTRCKEDKKVSVTFSNSILLQRDSKFWWNICWV